MVPYCSHRAHTGHWYAVGSGKRASGARPNWKWIGLISSPKSSSIIISAHQTLQERYDAYDCVLIACWLRDDYMLITCWLRAIWLHADSVLIALIALWLRADCVLIAWWLRDDCELITCWLRADCVLITRWLCVMLIVCWLTADCETIKRWLRVECDNAQDSVSQPELRRFTKGTVNWASHKRTAYCSVSQKKLRRWTQRLTKTKSSNWRLYTKRTKCNHSPISM